jgi:predicted CopG family antitoxin
METSLENSTTMVVSKDVWKEINQMREPGETFSSALGRLLDEYHSLKRGDKK